MIKIEGMKPRRLLNAALLTAALVQCPGSAAGAAEVSLDFLLREMVDYEKIARAPEPGYVFKQFSSYDRNSKTPANPVTWFANLDNTEGMGAALVAEKNQGRVEFVLFESDGPGAIVRMWFGGRPPKGTVRFYFDGSKNPGIEAPLYDFASGRGFAPEPFSIETARTKQGGGMNVYLPIPFAKHCKITYDELATPKLIPRTPPRWYHIDYRQYAPGTPVRTFSMAEYNSRRKEVVQAGKTLLNPPDFAGGKNISQEQVLNPGRKFSMELPQGPASVRLVRARVRADDPGQALRSVVIRLSFDGEETVWSPLGDFFGSGAGLNELESWYRAVRKDGTMTCRWVMPYQKSARVTVENFGKQPAAVRLDLAAGDWSWDERSMLFHANWRYDYPIPTRPPKDWNYIAVAGKGVYAGDALSVFSPVPEWWGEGDEKIWVDGESFPSVFGTGTEDYYGYSWGGAKLFQTPFVNQVRADGPKNQGNTVVTRTRNLDGIPFSKSLKFDMEIWHWKDCSVAYAVTTYWYAMPGASVNIKPSPDGKKALPGK